MTPSPSAPEPDQPQTLNKARVVLTPTAGVDPRAALATSMQAAPGVYAVLVGSGMSTSAGVPTGWGIVQDLIRRIARADGVSPDELADAPEEWWLRHGRPPPQYDSLLKAVARTDAMRQALLGSYFEPALPTVGHQALGRLCASGRVRLVVTTNFDRLIERAIEQQGITPQVVWSPATARAMIPLTQAKLTVVKLHGDYVMTGLRNTPEELKSYPRYLRRLLERVLDEYGLLVVGWSAEYDLALVNSILTSRSRRYPMYWATYQGVLTETGRRIVGNREAALIETAGADEFLSDLSDRISRLDETAARRTRPTRVRFPMHSPNDISAPWGWAALPLLQLRTVAAVGPASVDECEDFRPEYRERVLATLNSAAVTQWLRELSITRPASALTEPTGNPAPTTGTPVVLWAPAPASAGGPPLTAERGAYRIGGDASVGISALGNVMYPRWAQTSQMVFVLDIGLSLAWQLSLERVAGLLRDGLLLVGRDLPLALAGALPSRADVALCEVHLLAPKSDGKGLTRPNSLEQRVDWSVMGHQIGPLPILLGDAVSVSGPLTEVQAAEIAVGAIDYLALSHGFDDPRPGVAYLRSQLGLPKSQAPSSPH
jgi:SIR2-like domain